MKNFNYFTDAGAVTLSKSEESYSVLIFNHVEDWLEIHSFNNFYIALLFFWLVTEKNNVL